MLLLNQGLSQHVVVHGFKLLHVLIQLDVLFLSNFEVSQINVLASTLSSILSWLRDLIIIMELIIILLIVLKTILHLFQLVSEPDLVLLYLILHADELLHHLLIRFVFFF